MFQNYTCSFESERKLFTKSNFAALLTAIRHILRERVSQSPHLCGGFSKRAESDRERLRERKRKNPVNKQTW